MAEEKKAEKEYKCSGCGAVLVTIASDTAECPKCGLVQMVV